MKHLIIRIVPVIIGLFWSGWVNGQNADWKELQSRLDEAVRTNGLLIIDRDYTIDKPLVAAAWAGQDYRFFTVQVIGKQLPNRRKPRIVALFKDAPVLSLHKTKGSIVRGLRFEGKFDLSAFSNLRFYSLTQDTVADPSCRDEQFSPYCAIAVDPFLYQLPPDGGYPALRSYYKGKKSVSGSTGVRLEDCEIDGFTVGFITSPNGYTLNAELVTLENISLQNCKVGIAGCQAQEKLNRIINLRVLGNVQTILGFTLYGQGHPGYWIADTISIEGRVVQLVHRLTAGYFPLYISNVKANGYLLRIGNWQTKLSDRLDKANILFASPAETGVMPDYHVGYQGLTITNSSIRNKDNTVPLLFKGVKVLGPLDNKGGVVNGKYDQQQEFVKQLARTGNLVIDGQRKAVVKGTGVTRGQTVIFMNAGNWEFVGMGTVDEVKGDGFVIKHISPAIQSGKTYRLGIKR